MSKKSANLKRGEWLRVFLYNSERIVIHIIEGQVYSFAFDVEVSPGVTKDLVHLVSIDNYKPLNEQGNKESRNEGIFALEDTERISWKSDPITNTSLDVHKSTCFINKLNSSNSSEYSLTYQKVKEIVSKVISGKIIDYKWECNLLKEDRIEKHEIPGLESVNIEDQKSYLIEVLDIDLNFFSNSMPILSSIKRFIFFFDVYNSYPNGSVISFKHRDANGYAILFKTATLYYAHSFFSKVERLTSNSNPKTSSQHNNSTLLAGILNDLEVFFNESIVKRDIYPNLNELSFTYKTEN